MSHLYYWGAAIFIAAIIGFYGCYQHSVKPRSGSNPIDKIMELIGIRRTISACCYAPTRPASTVFTCPVCGSSTILVTSNETDALDASTRLEFAWQQLDSAGSAPDWKLEFDRTQFCYICTPARKGPPKLILIVHQKDEKDPHRVEGVTEDDLMLILDYIQGKTERYDPATGTNRPIEDYHARLNNLLGLSLSVEKQEGTTTNE